MAKEILIIEDEGTIAGLLRRSLTQKGYSVAVMDCQQALLDAHRRRGSGDGYVHEEMAENLLALGRGAEAAPQFAAAAELLGQDEALARDQPQRLARLRKLGGLP